MAPRTRRQLVVRGTAGIAVAALAVGLVLGAALWWGEPSLMRRAAVAVPASAGARLGWGYGWLSDSRVLVVRETASPSGLDQHEFLTYDTDAHTARPADALNRAIQGAGEGLGRDPEWSLSPDRRRVVLLYRGEGRIVPLDGGRPVPIEAGSYHSRNVWLSDSRSLLHAFLGQNGHALDHAELSIVRPGRGRRAADVPNSDSNPLDPVYAARGVGPWLQTLASVDPPDEPEASDRCAVFRRDMRRPSSQSARILLRLPHRAVLEDAAFSPDGKRVALLLDAARPTGMPAWVYRRIQWLFPDPGQRALELWTCALDGRDDRLVGVLRYHTEDDQPDLSGLDWMPDGKRLSFARDRKTLYVIPAE